MFRKVFKASLALFEEACTVSVCLSDKDNVFEKYSLEDSSMGWKNTRATREPVED